MSKLIPPLTEQRIEQELPREKSYKLFDGRGLYLEVMPSGTKSWRMKYCDQRGKEMRLSFGQYPEISLALARCRREVARQMLGNGHDPRTEFNAARIGPKPPVAKPRQLPKSIEAQQLRRLCKQAGEAALEHMFQTVFPSLLRTDGDEIARAEILELLGKFRHDHLKELTDLLSVLCTDFARDCVDAGIAATALNAAMIDTRAMPRWTRSI